MQESIDGVPRAYYLGMDHAREEAAKLFNDAVNEYVNKHEAVKK